ncbi:MAG: carboxypeptidase regulatory-like domain-containing protein [Acidobacteria bacterium]|nr:carboxypeptidase regulatory-like domain-containing protein [Acidobacteriota bacterium]
MKRTRSQRWLVTVALDLAVVAVVALPVPTRAASKPSGTIAGQVTDSRGVGQAGIPVTLLNQGGRFAQKVFYTQNNGRFRIEGLPPGTYAVEVLLPTFLPFWKAPVLVRSGAEVLLEINLRSLTESLEVRWPVNPATAREEWGWVLRSGSPPRPLLRFQEATGNPLPVASRNPQERPLHGTVQFWAGNESQGYSRAPGLHTTFGMEYEWNSRSVIEVDGSAGWEQNTPGASFRAAWKHQSVDGANSTFSAAVRQLFLSPEYWRSTAIASSPSDGRVQSVTVGYENESALGPKFLLHYGTLLDTLNAGQRTSRWSPFGRMTYLPSKNKRLTVEFTAAAPRALPSESALAQQKTERGLAIPQLSSGPDSRLALEGGSHLETSWEQEWDSRVRLQVAAFYDSLSAMAFALGGTEVNQWMAGLLRDPFTNLYFLSGGNFSAEGARAAAAAKIGDSTEVIIGYSYASGLRATSGDLHVQDSRNLQEHVRPQYGHSLAVQLRSTVPRIQTQVLTSYRWVPRNTVVAPDLYNRGFGDTDPYLNIILLQPIPSPEILPGRFQALADFSNFLGQGYLPVYLPNGEKGYLVPATRSFRGGFNFIF